MPEPTKAETLSSADAEALAQLSSADRLLIARHWQGRSRAEAIAAVRFAGQLEHVARLGTTSAVLELLSFAVGEEWRHVCACAKMAAIYAQREVQLPDAASERPPVRHDDGNIAIALQLLGTSCISEMIAAAWLQECLEATTVTFVRGALRELLKDDIRHARIGWAHLAARKVRGEDNERDLGPHVHEIFESYAAPWLWGEDFPEQGYPSHGLPARATTRKVVLATIRDLILPNFEQVGLNPSPGYRWLEAAERGA